MAKHLMTPPIQLIGRISDHRDAMESAQQFMVVNPHEVKDLQPVYRDVTARDGPFRYTETRVIDYNNIYYTVEEQDRRHARGFMDTPPFNFMLFIRGAKPELFSFSPPSTIYADPEEITKCRADLLKRDGRPRHAILEEIASRQGKMLAPRVDSADAEEDEPLAGSEPSR